MMLTAYGLISALRIYLSQSSFNDQNAVLLCCFFYGFNFFKYDRNDESWMEN